MHEMRRKNREVTDITKVYDILMSCEMVELGLYDEAEPLYPYVVPVNYIGRVEDGEMYIYIHGAKAGRKYELMKKNGKCSFVIYNNIQVDVIPEKFDITTRYESLMGKADIEMLEGEAAVEALCYLADSYAGFEFEWHHETEKVTGVARLKVTDWSCKANPIPAE
ncbi:MAG: pyridoxamine 5'-phosphate oxidase family protein [Firmicutes bacterium]|nr:pyridoxamine 5'-phosphate oxidase family protein [Bacillota bacterium]